MKKMIYMACMCAFALGLLSGCGGEFAEETEAGKDASGTLTGAAVSGHDVSGQAVSGQAVQPEEGENSPQAVRNRYCSERYYYTVSDEEGVTRISLATGEEKEIPVDGIHKLIYVEKDVLYCTKVNKDKYSESLWRIPIECRKDGSEELITDRAERVRELDDISNEPNAIYMDEESIVYTGVKRNKDFDIDLICYDRQSGKKVKMPASGEVRRYLDLHNTIEQICRYGDRLDFIFNGTIVSWDMGTDEIFARTDSKYSDGVSTEKAVFLDFEAPKKRRQILRIDMETKKEEVFIDEQEIMDVLASEAGIEPKQLQTTEMYGQYYDGGCLYIELRVCYTKGDTDYLYNIVLSRREAEGAPLRYEKGLSEYMREQGETEEYTLSDESGKPVGNEFTNYAECYGVSRGMVYVDLGEHEYGYGEIYDLKTGEVRSSSWKDELVLEAEE